MPTVRAGDIDVHYETQGSGEPLVLIPYLALDQACYAFQVAHYEKHYTCISVDLRDSGQTSTSDGSYTTEQLADDVARFLQAIGVERAHVSGLSLGAAVGLWLAAKYPEKVRTLSLHSAWPKTDPFVRTVVEGWQTMAKGAGVTEMIVQGIFPWCFTPELYAARPEYIDSLADFVRSRPIAPLEAFLRQSEAVLGHDASAQLGRITAPTQVTFGRHDVLCSTRFADELTGGIADTELVVFEDCSHAPIYENVASFNDRTLSFLQAHGG
jgi:pimeloyl-ACP methyl ester carboxylesterase